MLPASSLTPFLKRVLRLSSTCQPPCGGVSFLRRLHGILRGLLPSSHAVYPGMSFLPRGASSVPRRPTHPLDRALMVAREGSTPYLFLQRTRESSGIYKSSMRGSYLFHRSSEFLRLPEGRQLLVRSGGIEGSPGGSLSIRGVLPLVTLSIFSRRCGVLCLLGRRFQFCCILYTLLCEVRSLLCSVPWRELLRSYYFSRASTCLVRSYCRSTIRSWSFILLQSSGPPLLSVI